MSPKYIDAHCHPNLPGLKEEQESVIATMAEEGVLGIVVGTNLESSREAVRLAKKHEHLYATVGLHPNYTQKEDFDEAAFQELLSEEKVVGIGECGIDYFRQSTTKAGEEVGAGWKERQWQIFKQQVELALRHNKPLMVHCRPSKGSMDAYHEVADYFESLGQPPEVDQGALRGNMHFFVGNLTIAKRFWALGFTTSFTGVLTFTHDYDEVVREAPLGMILTETDAPWAAPAPHRGETNRPEYVRYVVEAVARIRQEPMEALQRAFVENATRLFNLDLSRIA